MNSTHSINIESLPNELLIEILKIGGYPLQSKLLKLNQRFQYLILKELKTSLPKLIIHCAILQENAHDCYKFQYDTFDLNKQFVYFKPCQTYLSKFNSIGFWYDKPKLNYLKVREIGKIGEAKNIPLSKTLELDLTYNLNNFTNNEEVFSFELKKLLTQNQELELEYLLRPISNNQFQVQIKRLGIQLSLLGEIGIQDELVENFPPRSFYHWLQLRYNFNEENARFINHITWWPIWIPKKKITKFNWLKTLNWKLLKETCWSWLEY